MSDLAKQAEKWIKETKKAAAKPLPQRLVEEMLGRPLEDYEAIMYKNGDKSDLSPENILIGFKAGVPYQYLTCRHCGNRVIGIEAIE